MSRWARCFLGLLLAILVAPPAFAATYYNGPAYITTSEPNSGAISDSPDNTVIADVLDGAPPPYIVTVKISYAGVESGDAVSVIFLDYGGSILSEEPVLSSGSTITAPSNTWKVKLHLVTGSATTTRWVWFSEAYNTDGNTTIFEAPDTGGGTEPPPTEPPPSEPTCDLTPVVTELQVIQSQLTTIMDGVNSRLDAVNSRLDQVNERLTQVISRLDGVNDRLDEVNDQLDTIYDYISTPRTASPINVNLPNVQIDPTPPPVEEPYRDPYTYNRPQPSPPPGPVDSPGPLPLAPDPEHYVLEHDEPAAVDPPRPMDPPQSRDPVTMDPPAAIDPPLRETPRERDPVTYDPPVQRDAPLTPDAPLTRDEPIPRDEPLTRDEPIPRDEPLTRDAPLVPDPPLTPDPPLG